MRSLLAVLGLVAAAVLVVAARGRRPRFARRIEFVSDTDTHYWPEAETPVPIPHHRSTRE